MPSRKLLTAALLISLLCLASVTHAVPPPAGVAYSGSATNNTGSVKTDYHVRVTNSATMEFIPGIPPKTNANLGIMPPGGTLTYVGEPTVHNNKSKELTFEWTNLTINDGDTIVWGVIFQSCGNMTEVIEEWFTPTDPTIDLPIPALGFRVELDGQLFLTNHTDLPISFEDLSVSIVDEGLSAEAMIDAVGESVDTGTGTGETVDNGSEYLVGTYSELEPGMFLQASMLASVAADDGTIITSRRMLQHEHPVEIPTVSQWGLTILAVLLVTAGAIAIVRRKQLAAG
jgi:hypothetical protein